MSFWEDLGSGLTSGDFLSSALNTGVSTIAGILGQQNKEADQEKLWAREDEANKQKTLLELQLAQLKAMYGGGGGGGGGAAPYHGLNAADLLTSKQNIADTKMAAIQNLLKGIQAPLLARGG